ncbi:MFS transporter [Dactylosporangium sp. NPDC049525]|uniref:MFS transporter n=1 Tax=Dactylosporangium sp. NPDC049525 TaxID=3154730 RepID=UPI00344AEC4B
MSHGRGEPDLMAVRRSFWVGVALVLAGVALHLPDYVMARHHDFVMAGMPMGGTMAAGMTLIVLGLMLAVRAVLPGRAQRLRLAGAAGTANFAALDSARMTRAHWALVVALTVGLVVDTMKPASLGFVVPGMAAEYGISTGRAALLPFASITGAVVGSIAWAYLADLIGRRGAIMLSAVIYVSTSICGLMPSFGWNLVMCLAMGASAGGMLPTVYSLMSESVPSRHRGAILVVQSGLGAVLGYLVASGAAAVLVPHYSWRALWLLGAPTGLLLLLLSRWVPESPRYLLAAGRTAEAQRVMARYGITTAAPAAPASPVMPKAGRGALLSDRYRIRTIAVVLYGLGWGAVNWGFVTLLPAFLTPVYGPGVSRLLFEASLLAVPATVVAAVLYERWSSRRTMLLYSALTAAALAGFVIARPDRSHDTTLLVVLLMVLLAGNAGMIAMLSPYSTEIFPTALRATGGGLAASATKVAGVLVPVLVLAPGLGLLAVTAVVPVAAAAIVLWRTGLETAGLPLVETEPEPQPVG